MFNPKENILDEQLAVSGIENNIFGFVADIFTGGAYSANKQARKQAASVNEYNQQMWEFDNEQALRSYNYAVDGLKILKRNTEANILAQEADLKQKYDYGMAIRNYEFSEELREYNQSQAQAQGQFSFNDIALRQANIEQDRYLAEQQASLDIQGDQTLKEYTIAAAGLDLKQRRIKAESDIKLRESRIEALKQAGQVRARGQAGVSSTKALQAVFAEQGARQQDIVRQTLFAGEELEIDFKSLSDQLLLDQASLDFSRASLLASDVDKRRKFDMQKLQADLNAEAQMMLRPELAPPLPAPFALPRPEYQDIFEPKVPPQPREVYAQTRSLASAFVSNTLGLAATAAGAGIIKFR